ncbi:MAG: Gfo/Idh/MocA family oxidoreductase [Betaproteobacteria bacterium]|nr:MAG: Gfo/Idh/MocA family oxidoreductase [Betaproteobacteria bacterium]
MPKRVIRYAVVGCGHIAQVAVLPAFGNARRNSKLAAIVSGDPVKREELRKKYDVERAVDYAQYDELLKSGAIDAVYIALPNSMLTEAQCELMAKAARDGRAKLMIAYRLHFERANLEAMEIARSGRIGEPRLFTSTFSMTVVPDNIRVKRALGGGVLYDIGIYCINAARSLFRDEPNEVRAAAAGAIGDVEESVSAVLRFSNERLASFTCSFGATKVSEYRLVGTKGEFAVDPAYEYAKPLEHRLSLEGNLVSERRFAKRDQFAPELLYFSDCVLQNRDPEPSAEEGLADVRVIRALYQSIESGQPVELGPYQRRERPSLEQEIRRPPIEKPQVIHAQAPSGGN